MPITLDWRSASAADEFSRLGRTGFAQEFLRLNDDYQHDYDSMAHEISVGAVSEDAATAALARRWGLSFRLRSKLLTQRSASPMAARARS